MTLEEAVRVLGPWPCKPDFELGASGNIHAVRNDVGSAIAKTYSKEDSEAIAVVLNDAWSRVPEEGEDCCATCCHCVCVNGNEGTKMQAVYDCRAPQPATDFGDRAYIQVPEAEGRGCPLWQRREME